jgi:5-dehydro-2-deoxygluconokinase
MSPKQRPLHLIALGRAGVDLYSEQINGRLEDTLTFNKYVGGSPCNVAIGTARLQLKSAMITMVGDDALGRYIIETLADEGVSTNHIETSADRLTGLVILGIEDKETFPLIFYRENCADMHILESQINKEHIASADALLLSGTHLSSEHSFNISALAAKVAQDVGTEVILDIDYRPTLWGLASKGDGENRYIASNEVTETIQALLPNVDLIVGTQEEIHIAGGSNETHQALENIRKITNAPIVLKQGAQGASFYREDLSKPAQHSGFEVEVMNVLGAGDAFLSGFLKGWLTKQSIERSLAYGNACGAIVVSRHGCSPAMPTMMELDLYLSMPTPPLTPNTHLLLNHTH